MQLLTFLFSFSLTYLHVTFSVEFCQESNPCACKFNDGFVDLSTVGLPGSRRQSSFMQFFILSGEHIFAYNPCYPFGFSAQDYKVDQLPCIDVAACVITPGNASGSPPTQRALGLQNSAVFSRDGGVITVNYSVPEFLPKNLTVTLECNMTVDHQLEIHSESSFTLTTRCACLNNKDCQTASPAHPKSGLSTGSILLITFFVILLVYVGVGILFNFCRGAHGTELLPNVEFWNELPKYIGDGFLFTCSCFGRRSSYADV